jgi:hypothetical protein
MKWFQKLPYADITIMHSSENGIYTEHALKMQHRNQQLPSLPLIITFFYTFTAVPRVLC